MSPSSPPSNNLAIEKYMSIEINSSYVHSGLLPIPGKVRERKKSMVNVRKPSQKL
jgi:hypothetical protein